MRVFLLSLLLGVLFFSSARASLDSLVVVRDSLAITPIDSIEVRPMQVLGRPAPLDMITNIPGDWWHWSKQTFTVKQLPVIAVVSALTAVTIITDYQSWQITKKPYDQSPTFKKINDVTSYLGDGKVQFGLAIAFAGYGFALNDDRAIRTASQTVEVILACGAVVQFLKHVTGRESPFTATTPTGLWRFFPNQIEYAKHVPHYDAFPSGHIATAFGTFMVIAENYPNEKWIQYIGYPVMASIATGLVATSIHWWSDIPLGVALGYSFGRLIAHPEQFTDTPDRAGELHTNIGMTFLSNGSPALSFMMKW